MSTGVGPAVAGAPVAGAGLVLLDGLDERLGDHHRLPPFRARAPPRAGRGPAGRRPRVPGLGCPTTNQREQHHLTGHATRLATELSGQGGRLAASPEATPVAFDAASIRRGEESDAERARPQPVDLPRRYVAGPHQSVDDPLGVNGTRLHEWVFATRTGRRMQGLDGGDAGLDDDFAGRGDAAIGATVMGRNMFGPIRGPWGDDPWTGWWGPNPPFHHPVFVLTHHRRPAISMEGGTTFHFVDAGADAAIGQALDAAAGQDVRVGGGADTIQQCLRAGLIDDLHLVIVPTLLGAGERLFDHLDGGAERYECVELVSSPSVTHARLTHRPA